jgi:hypothetical protein
MLNKSNHSEEESKIEELIKKKVPLEELFEDNGYLDEVTFQNNDLFKYLGNDEMVTKLFEWIYKPQLQKNYSFEKCSKYSFYAYSTVANCSPELTSVILKNPNHLKILFSLINDDNEENLTARGYFQTIIKNFLSDLNPYLSQFIKVLKINPELYIFPLIKNLTKANSEIIKDILGTNENKLKKLQLCVFEFLLFFYLNEQFESSQKISEIFDNIIDIFHFLKGQENIIYNYKLKYEYTLYSEEYVNKKEYCEPIYYLKLALLYYIASTKQIKTCKQPDKFLLSYKKYKNSKKFFFYLKELLNFFEVLSVHKEFFESVNFKFYKNLIAILEEFPFKDIIHIRIFKILENSKSFINKDKDTQTLVIDFLLKKEKEIKFPHETKKYNNPISLHYLFGLVNLIDLSLVTNQSKKENLQVYRDLLSTLFTKLCYVEENNDFSDVEEHSDVELVLKKDFHLYNNKNKKSMLNDKRFHYEDDIMKAEPLKNPESERIDTELFESKDEKIRVHVEDSDFSDFENLPEKNPEIVLNNFKDKSLLKNSNSDKLKNELFSPNNSNFDENKNILKSGFLENKNELFSDDEKNEED